MQSADDRANSHRIVSSEEPQGNDDKPVKGSAIRESRPKRHEQIDKKMHLIYLWEKRENTVREYVENYKKLFELIDDYDADLHATYQSGCHRFHFRFI